MESMRVEEIALETTALGPMYNTQHAKILQVLQTHVSQFRPKLTSSRCQSPILHAKQRRLGLKHRLPIHEGLRSTDKEETQS